MDTSLKLLGSGEKHTLGSIFHPSNKQHQQKKVQILEQILDLRFSEQSAPLCVSCYWWFCMEGAAQACNPSYLGN